VIKVCHNFTKIHRKEAETAPKMQRNCTGLAAKHCPPTPTELVPKSSKNCKKNAFKNAPESSRRLPPNNRGIGTGKQQKLHQINRKNCTRK
jgi:hypothetical protein